MDADDSVITEAAFAGFFKDLVDAAGVSMAPDQINDARQRWWRWCIYRPRRTVGEAFARLIRRIADDGAHVRFPGIADLRREYDVVIGEHARQKKKELDRLAADVAACGYCGGLGVVRLVTCSKGRFLLDDYAELLGEDGTPLRGGSLSDYACACQLGDTRRWLPRFSVGAAEPSRNRTGGTARPRPGWALEAVEVAKKLRADGLGPADVMAELIRRSKNRPTRA